MQNVLTFPTTNIKKVKRISALRQLKNFIENCKIRREEIYQEKIDFLKDECYKFYLRKILNERHKARVVDFPDFMYWQRLAICQEAINLSNLVVGMHERVYGRKFIEKCYNRRLQEIKTSLKK